MKGRKDVRCKVKGREENQHACEKGPSIALHSVSDACDSTVCEWWCKLFQHMCVQGKRAWYWIPGDIGPDLVQRMVGSLERGFVLDVGRETVGFVG